MKSEKATSLISRFESEWYYLRVFIDLFSRMVVGWDLSDSLERSSTIKALRKAIMRRQLRRKPYRGI